MKSLSKRWYSDFNRGNLEPVFLQRCCTLSFRDLCHTFVKAGRTMRREKERNVDPGHKANRKFLGARWSFPVSETGNPCPPPWSIRAYDRVTLPRSRKRFRQWPCWPAFRRVCRKFALENLHCIYLFIEQIFYFFHFFLTLLEDLRKLQERRKVNPLCVFEISKNLRLLYFQVFRGLEYFRSKFYYI